MGVYSDLPQFSFFIPKGKLGELNELTNISNRTSVADTQYIKKRSGLNKKVIAEMRKLAKNLGLSHSSKKVSDNAVHYLIYQFSMVSDDSFYQQYILRTLGESEVDKWDLVELSEPMYEQKHYALDTLLLWISEIACPYVPVEISEEGIDCASSGNKWRIIGGKVYAYNQVWECPGDPTDPGNCIRIWNKDTVPSDIVGSTTMVDADIFIHVPNHQKKKQSTKDILAMIANNYDIDSDQMHSSLPNDIIIGRRKLK